MFDSAKKTLATADSINNFKDMLLNNFSGRNVASGMKYIFTNMNDSYHSYKKTGETLTNTTREFMATAPGQWLSNKTN